MSRFRALIGIFKRELSFQEQLLQLLTKERVAIVKLNQEELDLLTAQKERLLEEGRSLEQKRSEIVKQILPEIESATVSVQQLIAACSPQDGKRDLTEVCDDLRRVATSVRDMNTENSSLIRQSLGLIATTIAIMKSAPASDLPRYNSSGTTSGDDGLRFSSRRNLSREA